MTLLSPRNRHQALAAAEQESAHPTHWYKEHCLQAVREDFEIPSFYYDAITAAQHSVFSKVWLGGLPGFFRDHHNGHGHIVITDDEIGTIWSTDIYRVGRVDKTTVATIQNHWNMTWLGCGLKLNNYTIDLGAATSTNPTPSHTDEGHTSGSAGTGQSTGAPSQTTVSTVPQARILYLKGLQMAGAGQPISGLYLSAATHALGSLRSLPEVSMSHNLGFGDSWLAYETYLSKHGKLNPGQMPDRNPDPISALQFAKRCGYELRK